MYFELYRDTAGNWRWRLVAQNGNKLANGGEGYKNKADCLSAMASVAATTTDTPIREL